MFASLKSKIKEETGNDISKLTSSWRAGSFLQRMTMRDDGSSSTSTNIDGHGDTSESISPPMESYLLERTGGTIDQSSLQLNYTTQLEAKLKERDAMWEKKIEELKISSGSVQEEEIEVSQAVARAAQAEATKATNERDAALKQLQDITNRLSAAERAQEKLDVISEELEQSRREWARERSELTASLNLAEAKAKDLTDELALIRSTMPTDSEHHQMHEDDKREYHPTGCSDYDALSRQKAVLTRQLQEAKMALADVKTSWSSQIASLETQVARMARQAGEEGAERRRVEAEKRLLQEQLVNLSAELEKIKQNLANSDAKVVRLNGEVHALAMEVKSLRSSTDHAAEQSSEFESKLQQALEENEELKLSLDNERTLVGILKEKIEKSSRLYSEKVVEFQQLTVVLADLQKDYAELKKMLDKERREKDEALLRNAHMSQTIEMSKNDSRYHQSETLEVKKRLDEMEAIVAQHKENQATCMLIKENEVSRLNEIEQLKKRIEELGESENTLRTTIDNLEADICDKNKKIKILDNRISDMKKTLQREIQSSKTEMSSAEEQDISRKYLKHVILRFLTAHEIEARQLTRALSVLLRLTAHEEAMLRSALPPRGGLTSWFPSLGNT